MAAEIFVKTQSESDWTIYRGGTTPISVADTITQTDTTPSHVVTVPDGTNNLAIMADFSTPTGSCTVKIYGWPGTTGAPGVCIGTLYFTADPSVRITPGFRYNCQEERVIDIHGKKRIAFLITTVVGNVVLRGHGF